MPVVTTFLKKTHGEVVVKVAGTPATTPSSTINLTTDLLATGQEVDGATQTVNIVGVTWTGASASVVTITRNNVTVMTLQADAAGALEFGGQMMLPDTTSNTSPIVVTVSGTQAECWLRLRKVGGYKTRIEPDQFGIYDNPAVAGS
jgi:hypothetical protein